MKLIRFLLFPFAILYDLVTTIRNMLFDVHFFKSTSFKIPVIVVGNLSVGGTGKTPQIEYLIRLLKDATKVAVLSRGYKRKTKGFLMVNNQHTANDVGDEPLQYFKKFTNINVAVHENRVEGIANLLAQKSSEIVLLDDAYQHRKVKGSFYILLTKYDDLFTDDFLLPTGNLRESNSGAKRTDVIVVTKCPFNIKNEEKEQIKIKLKKFNKEVFFTTISYSDKITGSQEISLNELKNFEVLLITGIANPNSMIAFLSEKNIKFTHLKYADHHHFSSKEIEVIQEKFKSINADKKLILTTEKDYTRLSNKIQSLSFLEIETSFIENQHKFDAIIKAHIQENRC
ncbi:tetraacyldisaccharide 4'-kinase [Polaribacter glomeratus]|uniref:Tetraacyldisaccharide 4'-kinase n=1 Tax=Polaribacter glomeratus TaxID=102 RepID=A0A2S7WY06_9FLAO|nr:tetraacyldisaccharide 4'-kinase [Polaribacter glomeratus]PQJ82418.1 tetraacyldisaccharide 4'-kinase [Polaribacter glomeratus]TXD64343.1 tetraacyldisaccharide 4'-kinase [Polaribacter glomeratus]